MSEEKVIHDDLSYQPSTFYFEDIKKQFYQIPIYQRSYSWYKDKALLFFEDLIFDKNPNSLFCGSTITKKIKGKERHLEIIDGQQRFITSMIILAAIRDITKDNLNREDAKYKKIKKWLDDCIFDEPLLSNEKIPRIKVGSLISKTFNKIVIDDTDFKEKNKIKLNTVKTKSEENIVRNYKEIYNVMSKHIVDNTSNDDFYLDKFILQLITNFSKIHCIDIKVTDEKTAYEIFITVNAKNDPLTSFDLTKTLILNQIDAKTNDEEDKWNNIIENINNEVKGISPQSFLRYFWIGKYEFVQDRILFDSIQRHGSLENPLDFKKKSFKPIKKREEDKKSFYKILIDELDKSSLVLRNIKKSDIHFFKENFGDKRGQEIALSLQYLNKFESVKQPYIYILSLINNALVSKNKVDSDIFINVSRAVSKIVKIIEVFSFEFHILAGGQANKVERTVYSNYAKELYKINKNITKNKKWHEKWSIHQVRKISSILDNTLSTHLRDNDTTILDIVANLRYDNKKTAVIRYVFEKINQVLHNQDHLSYNANATIEHILPQNPTNWSLKSEEIKDYVHSIGNLAVINGSLNNDLSDASFKEKVRGVKNKKSEYINKLSDDETAVNQKLWENLERILKQGSVWNNHEILKRSKKIGELFDKAVSKYKGPSIK